MAASSPVCNDMRPCSASEAKNVKSARNVSSRIVLKPAATPELARRVIFVTGDVAGTDAETFLDESGCRWLAKPFRLGELLRAVREGLV